MKKKKLSKYEIEAMVLIIFAFILICASLLPVSIIGFAGILQGIATGLISGIVLLLITGQKSKEGKALDSQYNVIHNICFELISIGESYTKMYYQTYRGKKDLMNFNEYLDIIKETYQKFLKSYEMLNDLQISLIEDNDIKKNLDAYLNLLNQTLYNINQGINNITNDDIRLLNVLRITFFKLQNRALENYYKCNKLEQFIYEKKKIVDTSLI